MKKIILSSLLFLALFTMGAQTAVNFNANDCNGNNHVLFNELDAGKVVILCWVMPCSSCLSTALGIQANVQNYNNTNPGLVKYYVVDDLANTSCTTLQNWCSNNGVTGRDAEFSNSSIKMSDYGSNAMPKTVILAGQTHSVFLVQDGALVNSTFTVALSQAVNAAITTGLEKNTALPGDFHFYPNPASEKIFFKDLEKNSKVQLYNASGAKMFDGVCEKSQLDISGFSAGLYFLKVNGNRTVKLCITH